MITILLFILVLATLGDDNNETRRILRSGLWFLAAFWCFRILLSVGFALLPFIIVCMILGKIVFPFLRGFFSRF